MSEVTADYDSPWKLALERYFASLILLCLPQMYQEIDWSRGYESLDAELQQIARDAESGRRLADKLFRVWLKDGTETWVLVHVEVQGQQETGFSQRMFQYNYRGYDRFERPVVSIAVLTDAHRGWRPDRFSYSKWGCTMSFEFPVIKLMDFEDRIEELERSTNPFAPIIVAHLKTQATAKEMESRLQWKFRIVRNLLERGFARDDVLELFRIIDWMMVLPKELTVRFDTAMIEYEEKRKVTYITSTERNGMERGVRQGLQQGLQEGVLTALRTKFGGTPAPVVEAVTAITEPQRLTDLLSQAISASSLEEFQALLTRHA